MPYAQFTGIVLTVILCSCASELALIRPLKAWPAARWIDHPHTSPRWFYRSVLFVACILPPLAFAWIAAGLIARYFEGSIEPNRLIPLLQAAILFVPLPFAYYMYRALLAHVRNRIAKVDQ